MTGTTFINRRTKCVLFELLTQLGEEEKEWQAARRYNVCRTGRDLVARTDLQSNWSKTFYICAVVHLGLYLLSLTNRANDCAG